MSDDEIKKKIIELENSRDKWRALQHETLQQLIHYHEIVNKYIKVIRSECERR